MEDDRYTLDEAAKIIAHNTCAAEGHDLNQIKQFGNGVVDIVCERCHEHFVPAATARTINVHPAADTTPAGGAE